MHRGVNGSKATITDSISGYQRSLRQRNRELLWSLLKWEGLGQDFIQLLQGIYYDSEVKITWRDLKCTEPVVINGGINQGCFLSPLLFTPYMARLERKLDSGIGFNLFAEKDRKWNNISRA